MLIQEEKAGAKWRMQHCAAYCACFIVERELAGIKKGREGKID